LVIIKTGKISPILHTSDGFSELIPPVIGRQSAGEPSHIPGDRLPLLSARLAVPFPAAVYQIILLGDRGTRVNDLPSGHFVKYKNVIASLVEGGGAETAENVAPKR